MLNIFTNINKEDDYIHDVESMFNVLLYSETFDDKIYRNILKKVDNVSKKKGIYIETPFGSTYLGNISTGCKAVMLVVYYGDKGAVVNVTECGDNAINMLFELGKKIDMNVYTCIPISTLSNSIKCNVNGEELKGGEKIYRKLVANIE